MSEWDKFTELEIFRARCVDDYVDMSDKLSPENRVAMIWIDGTECLAASQEFAAEGNYEASTYAAARTEAATIVCQMSDQEYDEHLARVRKWDTLSWLRFGPQRVEIA